MRVERIAVVPDADGIAPVRHTLETMNVRVVRCVRADGSGVGYRFFQVITKDEVEVATVPGSGVVAVVVEAADDLP